MDQAQHFLSQPGVGFLALIIIGAIAGWVAEKATSSNHGIFTNILVGVAGSFIGKTVADLLQVPVFGFWRTLIAAIIGAIILLYVWRMLMARRSV
jgi:uncharacterized membrane protein YeaQ/YmgE (transglycosylase-associated protein family)